MVSEIVKICILVFFFTKSVSRSLMPKIMQHMDGINVVIIKVIVSSFIKQFELIHAKANYIYITITTIIFTKLL